MTAAGKKEPSGAAGGKRKLSASKVEEDPIGVKKAKVNNTSEDEDVDADEDGDEESGSGTGDERTGITQPSILQTNEHPFLGTVSPAEQPELKDDGPHTFYLWADALTWLLTPDEAADEETATLRLKSSMLKLWSSIEDLPKDERDEAVFEYLENTNIVHLVISEAVDGAHETSAAKKLIEDHEAQNGDWWWEVDLQRNELAGGAPGLMVTEDSQGETWWITAIRPADSKKADALSYLVDFLTGLDD
ncbi:unnamed protein product [Somion occarium]|uniref:Uncharacterized protein n=1 Tax=Somion occarium TaxID=3059160 RepID=A0ABP1E6A2_9APHY